MMPRLDRLATLYCFYPLKKIKSSDKELRIPILMYHSISEDNENGVHPYYRTTTSPAVFNEQMKYLHDNNYSVITLSDAVSLLKNQSAVPRLKPQTVNLKPLSYVVITFDDGFSDFYHEAFPILKEHGFRATVFLATAYVDGEPFKAKQCLNWEQILELHAAGITFGSHTHTHPQLRDLPRSAIAQELWRSKNIIEDKIGSAVTDFSYPYRFPEENGEFKGFLGEELEKAGYTHGVTTTIGRYRAGDSRMFIKRLPANSADDEPFLDAKLKGGYDWLSRPQFLYKKLKSSLSRWDKSWLDFDEHRNC